MAINSASLERAGKFPWKNLSQISRTNCRDFITIPKKATGILYHDLRRSCARNLTQAGVPREVAKTVTGHASDSCWNRYNIVITADARKALEQTEVYRQAEKAKVVAVR